MTSMGYQKAEMQVFLADDESYVEDCLVKITDDHVRVEYLEAGETRAYAGRALAPATTRLRGKALRGAPHCIGSRMHSCSMAPGRKVGPTGCGASGSDKASRKPDRGVPGRLVEPISRRHSG